MDDLLFAENVMKSVQAISTLPTLDYFHHPRTLVFQRDKVKLYHYQNNIVHPNAKPLLVVFATVNRPEILELSPDHSFIGGLLSQGNDVYLLDWGYPTLEDQLISFSDYVDIYLKTCVDFIVESRQSKVNLLGICQGGLICLCYTALYDNISKLVLISAPVDFHTQENTIAHFLNQIDMPLLAKTMGNISGKWLTNFFISLRPFELAGKKYLRFVDKISDDKSSEYFLRVEKWLHDAPDQPGKAFVDFTQDFYKHNKLVKGEVFIHHRPVDLSRITIPIFNLMAEEDEIIPVSATSVLNQYVSSSYFIEKTYPSGHIGIYVSEKVGKQLPEDITAFLAKNSL